MNIKPNKEKIFQQGYNFAVNKMNCGIEYNIVLGAIEMGYFTGSNDVFVNGMIEACCDSIN